jgi:hypothetical protein
MNGSGSESCRMTDFGNSDVESQGCATVILTLFYTSVFS